MVPEWLLRETFRVEHNPNCPSQFLVRLPRVGSIKGTAQDWCGYGHTLEQAATDAREKRAAKETTGGQP